MKQWSEIIRNVTMLSQLGLSLITPVLICLAVCWLIVSKTGAGGWVYIPGFSLVLEVQGQWHINFIFLLTDSRGKRTKREKTKYHLTDIFRFMVRVNMRDKMIWE